jgi:hypothetical protein
MNFDGSMLVIVSIIVGEAWTWMTWNRRSIPVDAR